MLAFSELDILRDKLGLSNAVIEKIAYIYRRAQERQLARGRSISGMLTAAIYIACIALRDRRLDLHGRQVLARRVDHLLLLAADDPVVAVLVDAREVAGVRPAVRVEHHGRLLGVVAVAGARVRPAQEQLATASARGLVTASLAAEPRLHGRQRQADRAELDPVDRVHDRHHELAHPPQLGEVEPERVVELEHRVRARGGGDRDPLRLVEAEVPADGSQELVGLAGPCRRVGVERRAGLLRADPREADLERCLQRRVGVDQGAGAVEQLLVGPGDAEEARGAHVVDRVPEVVRVGHARERPAQPDRRVVADEAVGDVRRGQEGDAAVGRGAGRERDAAREAVHDRAVRDLNGLRRAGRARGVDERRDRLGRHGPPRGVEVEARILEALHLGERRDTVGRLARVAVDHDVAQLIGLGGDGERAVEELRLRHQHLGAGVEHEREHLVDRLGVVDRERHGAEVQDRRVDDVEGGAVAEQERHGLRRPDAEREQAGGDGADAAGVLVPRHGLVGAVGEESGPVAARACGDLERGAERRRGDRLGDRGLLGTGRMRRHEREHGRSGPTQEGGRLG